MRLKFPAQITRHRMLRNRRAIKIVGIIILTVFLAYPPLVNLFVSQAQAGTLTQYKVQINNSQAAASNVTYGFYWTTSATTSIKQIDILVCTTPSGTCTAPAGFSTGTPTISSDNIAGTGRTVSGSTANKFDIVVTTPATQSTQTMNITFTGVTNPTGANTTYYVRSTTYSDTGTTVIDGTTSAAFAVLNTNTIALSATVDPNFTFTVARAVSGVVGAGTGQDTINVSTTTNDTIPFGSLNTTTASVSAHDITITTNATNGYEVIASQSAQSPSNATLVSGTDHIDSFTDAGGTNAAPASWANPSGAADSDSGYFAYTTNSTALCIGTGNRFNNTKYAGLTTTGGEVACSTAGVNSQTTRVGWKLGIDNLQPAGAYTGTVILIATPTY